MSCLGRERMFQYFSSLHGTTGRAGPPELRDRLRLRRAARHRRQGAGRHADRLVDGHVNVIWQGDANEAILRCLARAGSPPEILNLTGPEVLSVRELALAFGRRLGRDPVFTGREAPDALLSNSARYVSWMGSPRVPVERMLDWIAGWVRLDGERLNKPTHYDTRDGKF